MNAQMIDHKCCVKVSIILVLHVIIIQTNEWSRLVFLTKSFFSFPLHFYQSVPTTLLLIMYTILLTQMTYMFCIWIFPLLSIIINYIISVNFSHEQQMLLRQLISIRSQHNVARVLFVFFVSFLGVLMAFFLSTVTNIVYSNRCSHNLTVLERISH